MQLQLTFQVALMDDGTYRATGFVNSQLVPASMRDASRGPHQAHGNGATQDEAIEEAITCARGMLSMHVLSLREVVATFDDDAGVRVNFDKCICTPVAQPLHDVQPHAPPPMAPKAPKAPIRKKRRVRAHIAHALYIAKRANAGLRAATSPTKCPPEAGDFSAEVAIMDIIELLEGLVV